MVYLAKDVSLVVFRRDGCAINTVLLIPITSKRSPSSSDFRYGVTGQLDTRYKYQASEAVKWWGLRRQEAWTRGVAVSIHNLQ